MRSKVYAIGCALALLLAWGQAARADEVPPNLGILVMLKVLTYDNSFDGRGKGDFVVLVPFAQGQQAAADALVKVGNEIETKKIHDRVLRYVAIKATSAESKITEESASALLIPSSTPPEVAKDLADVAKAHNLYTLSFDENLVKNFFIVGVALQNGKPLVLINATQAKNMNAAFSPSVLRVARVYQ